MKKVFNYLMMAAMAAMACTACKKDDPKSAACKIVTFSVDSEAWAIDGTGITHTYPAETEVTSLTPVITLSPGATVNPPANRSQNFFAEGGVAYTVTAEDGMTTKTYTVKATRVSYTACDIVAFSVDGVEWMIAGTDITYTCPEVTSLMPVITLSPGATVNPPANTAQNFFTEQGVTYTVTAEDGTTTKTYTAKATRALPPVDPETGLTGDIQDLVPQEIIQAMQDLGLPVYGGNTPPFIEGTYVVRPLALIGTNIVNDYYSIGHVFAPAYITFSQQNNSNLTLKADETQGTAVATGTGAFIVGEGSRFSVFIYFTRYRSNINTTYKTVNVYSGTISPDGIIDCTYSFIMLDDGGDPQNALIENGEGRVCRDSDGLSERIESAPTIQKQSTKPDGPLLTDPDGSTDPDRSFTYTDLSENEK